MKYGEFPLGHCQVYARETFALEQAWTRPEQNKYKGLIYCSVLPPQHLRRPLLPYRTKKDGRLVFPLCRRCADKRCDRCEGHTERDRAWSAAFTHSELNKVILI